MMAMSGETHMHKVQGVPIGGRPEFVLRLAQLQLASLDFLILPAASQFEPLAQILQAIHYCEPFHSLIQYICHCQT